MRTVESRTPKTEHRAGEEGSGHFSGIGSEGKQTVKSMVDLVKRIAKELQDKEDFLIAKAAQGLKQKEFSKLLEVSKCLTELKGEVLNPHKDFLDLIVAYKKFLELLHRINFFYYNPLDNLPDHKACSEKIAEILKILNVNRINFQKMPLEEEKEGKTSFEALKLVKIKKLSALIQKNDNQIAALNGAQQDLVKDKFLSILDLIKGDSEGYSFELFQSYYEKITQCRKLVELIENKKDVAFKEVLEGAKKAEIDILALGESLGEAFEKVRDTAKLAKSNLRGFASTQFLSILEIIKAGSERYGFEFVQIYDAKITKNTKFVELTKNSYRVFSKNVLEAIKIEFSKFDELIKKISHIQKKCRKILLKVPEIGEIDPSENFPGEQEIITMSTARSYIIYSLSRFFKIETDRPFDFVMERINSVIKEEESLERLDKLFGTLVKAKVNLQQIFLRFNWLEPELQKLEKISHDMRALRICFPVSEKKEEVISLAESDDEDESTKRIQDAFFMELKELEQQKQEMQSQIKTIRKDKILKEYYREFEKNYLFLCKIKEQIEQRETVFSEVRDTIDALLFPTENLAQSIFSGLQKVKSSQIKSEIKEAKEEKVSLYQESQNFIDKYLSPIGQKVIDLEKSILASQEIWRVANARHTTRVVEQGVPGETELTQLKEKLLAALRPLQAVLGLPDSTKDLLPTILIAYKAYVQEHTHHETVLTPFLQAARDAHKKCGEIAKKLEQLKGEVEQAQKIAEGQQKILGDGSHKPQKKKRYFKKKSASKALALDKSTQQSERPIPVAESSVATQVDLCVPSGLQALPLKQKDELLLRTAPKERPGSDSDLKYGMFSKSFTAPKPLYAELDKLDQKNLAKNFQSLLESKIEWKSDLSPEVSAQRLKLMNYHQCALLMKFTQFYESLSRGSFDAFLSGHKKNIDLIQSVRDQIFHFFPIIIAANWSKISTDPKQQVSFYHEILSMTCCLQESIATGDFTKLAGNSFFDKYSKATGLLVSLKVTPRINEQPFHYFENFNQDFPTDFSLLSPDIIQLAQDFITGVRDVYARKTHMPRENEAAAVRHSPLGMTI